MSLNLHLSDGEDGKEIYLWQTPSTITNMCLSYDPTGEPDGGMPGVMRRYKTWVRGHTNGVWKSKDDLDLMRERIDAHLKELDQVKTPVFWGM